VVKITNLPSIAFIRNKSLSAKCTITIQLYFNHAIRNFLNLDLNEEVVWTLHEEETCVVVPHIMQLHSSGNSLQTLSLHILTPPLLENDLFCEILAQLLVAIISSFFECARAASKTFSQNLQDSFVAVLARSSYYKLQVHILTPFK
jgi:hypothetical protein